MKMFYDRSSGKARYRNGLPVGVSNWKITFLLISVSLGNLVESRQTNYHKYHHIKPTDVHQESSYSGYDTGHKKAERIIQGTPAEAHEFTSYAGLFVKDVPKVEVACGATLISKRLALTAAHCVGLEKMGALALLVGENDQSKINSTGSARIYPIKKLVPHPDYIAVEGMGSSKDIAIIETLEEMRFDQYVGPARLPCEFSDPLYSQSVTLVGMGMTTCDGSPSDVLLKTSAIINLPLSCGSEENYVGPYSEDEILCTTGRDGNANSGDSGGPVYYKDSETDALVLIGVITNILRDRQICTTLNVNIRVHSYLTWIQENYPGETLCGQ